jgi:hypothetical protein
VATDQEVADVLGQISYGVYDATQSQVLSSRAPFTPACHESPEGGSVTFVFSFDYDLQSLTGTVTYDEFVFVDPDGNTYVVDGEMTLDLSFIENGFVAHQYERVVVTKNGGQAKVYEIDVTYTVTWESTAEGMVLTIVTDGVINDTDVSGIKIFIWEPVTPPLTE